MMHEVGDVIGNIAIDPIRGGKESAQRQPKHGMNGNSSCINCSNSRGRNHDIFFAGFTHKIVQEGGFPGSGFPGEKYTAVRMFN